MTIFDELDIQQLNDAVNKHLFKNTFLTIIKGYIGLKYFIFQNVL
nr:MAG TPA: hypothetical protein [Caudoviricetes sp.]